MFLLWYFLLHFCYIPMSRKTQSLIFTMKSMFSAMRSSNAAHLLFFYLQGAAAAKSFTVTSTNIHCYNSETHLLKVTLLLLDAQMRLQVVKLS